jgi:DNA-binding transcriptional MerR regulator
MQMGLVDRPIGETRAAHYLSQHLDQLLKVKQLSDAGISLERIAEIQNGEELQIPTKPRKPGDIQVKSHIHIAPGIELQISPEEADMSPEQIRALVKAVMKTIQEIKA